MLRVKEFMISPLGRALNLNKCQKLSSGIDFCFGCVRTAQESAGTHPDLRQTRRLDWRLLIGPLC